MFAISLKVMKVISYGIGLGGFFLFILLCEKSTSPVLSGQVRLTVEEVGVTEAWVGVKTEQIAGEFSLNLWRDDRCIFQGVLSSADTTVYDSSLLPAHRYIYRARLERGGYPVLESTPVEIMTMDTTSHEFQWEIIEIPSPFGSGVLRDVAIINENDIWAVGHIFSDSAQPWLPYNAVHWDGQQWELERINYEGTPWPITAVYAFSSNDVWFEAFVKWNGERFIELPIPDILIGYGINKMWGTSSNDFYIVGNSGLIAHYDGQSWQRMESGTSLPIQDIWGVVDSKTGQENILAVACNLFHNEGIAVLQITHNTASQIQTDNLPVNISGVWSWKGQEWYACGSGLYKTRAFDKPWKKVSGLPPILQMGIRGNGTNDIFVVGQSGLVLHHNGSTWRQYAGLPGTYDGLAIKDDLVAVVGTKLSGIMADSGIILIGRRN